MIAYLAGKIKFNSDNFVVIENNGIGYKVFAPTEVCLKAKSGNEIELYIHQHVREDALQLFGFRSYDELKLFEQLISVSGIGPKTAMAVFAEAKIQDIVSAIVNADASILKRVSGIGAKTAERIILELKNKVAASIGLAKVKTKEELGADSDAIEALVSLGYSTNQAREALKTVDPSIADVTERVRAALKEIR